MVWASADAQRPVNLQRGVDVGGGKSFTEAGRQLFLQAGRNDVRVEAVGDSIETWSNGKPGAVVRDAMTLHGFIAFQVHTIGQDASKLASEIRGKNVRLTDLTPQDNTLSAREKSDGWRLLWDGKTGKGWRGAKLQGFPTKGWEMKDGVLSVLPSGGKEAAAGGDIVTTARYSDFELLVDFRITEGANSGIKVFCQPNLDPVTGTGAKADTGSAIGLEYQILDDLRHPDAKLGRDGNRTLGSLYDLLTAGPAKRPEPVGEWNTARIVSKGRHVEHWLNGSKILEYDRGSEAFSAAVSASKFKSIPGFGLWADGHVLLQDHGDRVSFKNIKIRTTEASK